MYRSPPPSLSPSSPLSSGDKGSKALEGIFQTNLKSHREGKRVVVLGMTLHLPSCVGRTDFDVCVSRGSPVESCVLGG